MALAIPCFENRTGVLRNDLVQIARAIGLRHPRGIKKRDLCRLLNDVEDADKANIMAERLRGLGFEVDWQIESVDMNNTDGNNRVFVTWSNGNTTFEPADTMQSLIDRGVVEPNQVRNTFNDGNAERQPLLNRETNSVRSQMVVGKKKTPVPAQSSQRPKRKKISTAQTESASQISFSKQLSRMYVNHNYQVILTSNGTIKFVELQTFVDELVVEDERNFMTNVKNFVTIQQERDSTRFEAFCFGTHGFDTFFVALTVPFSGFRTILFMDSVSTEKHVVALNDDFWLNNQVINLTHIFKKYFAVALSNSQLFIFSADENGHKFRQLDLNGNKNLKVDTKSTLVITSVVKEQNNETVNNLQFATYVNENVSNIFGNVSVPATDSFEFVKITAEDHYIAANNKAKGVVARRGVNQLEKEEFDMRLDDNDKLENILHFRFYNVPVVVFLTQNDVRVHSFSNDRQRDNVVVLCDMMVHELIHNKRTIDMVGNSITQQKTPKTGKDARVIDMKSDGLMLYAMYDDNTLQAIDMNAILLNIIMPFCDDLTFNNLRDLYTDKDKFDAFFNRQQMNNAQGDWYSDLRNVFMPSILKLQQFMSHYTKKSDIDKILDAKSVTDSTWPKYFKLLFEGIVLKCNNQLEPFEAISALSDDAKTTVDEIDPEMFIRLNGQCWDVYNLVGYIINQTDGKNENKLHENYLAARQNGNEDAVAPPIWRNQMELEAIYNHPSGEGKRLRKFIRDKEKSEHSKLSEELARKFLLENGSLLWARGEHFHKEFGDTLSEEQKLRWEQLRDGITLYEMPRNLPEDLNEKVVALKAGALAQLADMWSKMTSKEQEAILHYTKKTRGAIERCFAGDMCVMIIGASLVKGYNRWAADNDKETLNLPDLARVG